jgi:hypothetical protein
MAGQGNWGEVVASVWTDAEPLVDPTVDATTYFVSTVNLDDDIAEGFATGKLDAPAAVREQTNRHDTRRKEAKSTADDLMTFRDLWPAVKGYLRGDRADTVNEFLPESRRTEIDEMINEMREILR